MQLDWRKHRNAPHLVEVGRSGTWESGLYFLRVTTTDGRVAYAPLILRPKTLGAHRVAVVLPTNTWQAYNFRDGDGDGWGDSWYIGGATRTIDLRRPYVEPGLPYRFHDWSATIATWLRQTGKKVDYLSDDDLAAAEDGSELRKAYDLVVFAGHEEYVTPQMYDVVQRYRDLGGNLMFLSANNFFWKVTRQGQILRRVELWRKLGRPEAALIGVQWVGRQPGSGREAVRRRGSFECAVGLRGHRARERLDLRALGSRDRRAGAELSAGGHRPRAHPGGDRPEGRRDDLLPQLVRSAGVRGGLARLHGFARLAGRGAARGQRLGAPERLAADYAL